MGDEARRRLTSGKRIVSEKKKKNTFGSGVTSLTVSTKAQPYKGGDEVPIQVTVKNSTSKTIAALMIQMEAQECDGDDVHTQRASWVEYFQDGSFPLEGNNDYEGEILHVLPAKMTRVSSDNLSYRLSVQLKFKGFPGGKIVTHLPLLIVDDEEWDRYQKEHQNGSRHNSDASEEKVAQKKKGKKKDTNKKTKAKKKKSESEEEEEEEEDDSNSDNEKKKKKN